MFLFATLQLRFGGGGWAFFFCSALRVLHLLSLSDGLGEGNFGCAFLVLFFGVCWAKTARNAARFSIWFSGSWFGAVDRLFGKVLSVLGVSFRSSVGSNCLP